MITVQEIIREAVVNSLVHRDYSIPGAKVQLEINPEKIVVKSPGAPFWPNPLEKLQDFSATSYARNSNIAFIFNIMRLMEETGVGMDTFKSLRIKYHMPLPIIAYDGLNIVVTFPRSADALRMASNIGALKLLNDEELAGYDFIKATGKVARKDYRKQFGFEIKKAERHLTKMVKLKLIERKGSGPKTYYEFIAS